MPVFFYDILVYNLDIIEHERHLGVVFNILRDNELYVNQKKCVIGHSTIQYLGHWISSRWREIQAMVKTQGCNVTPEILRVDGIL